MTCTVVTNGTFPWWDLPALLAWHHRVYPSPFPPVSLSSIQYYHLLRHTLSLPSSMWLLTSRASPIVLPETLYPANTPNISLYTRISYIDFQANIMELRFHPKTINELRRAYDYFLHKSYALRMYNLELKTALRGRFLYRLESWMEKIGCEAIKAATPEDVGCGDLGAWCKGMVQWEVEEVGKLKAKKWKETGQPERFITVGEQAVINRYREIIGSLKEEKQGRKERVQKTKAGVVEYVKAGFVPCLEDAPDIWRMTFKVPKGWVWASYPEHMPIPSPSSQIPATPSGALRNRKLSCITTKATDRTIIESRQPGTLTAYQAGTEWHPRMDIRSEESHEDWETPARKRVRPFIDENEESPMDFETPRTSVLSTVQIDPLQKMESPTSTPVFWPPDTHSAGQETAPAALPSLSPADLADTRVLTASWDRQIKVLQRQNQGLPSPRLPLPYSPLSYMKHRTRRMEARKIVTLERESIEEQMEDGNVGVRSEGGPISILSSPLLPAQKPELYPPTPPAEEQATQTQISSSPILLISSSPIAPGGG
ncbi:hypothetical protein L211DRAFT_899899 [Terfezia boudieri ATCC MYA-4762]|uniref:Uncharacterized protein n=1 Tax=Terfezia boudieri ATCC MYA-4762 TaxID=1051890 RepID=A0A3N4M9V3_9PEZI|nr:hypothetical protein L211DRAFT_899899 [Terfezia boudieri ATCC MYA-4762]